MHHITFGCRTGLRVSEYALGTANFGTGPSATAQPDEARAIFEAFAEAGGTFIDTADRYQNGQSEAVLSGLLAGDRDRFVLSTKYTRGSGGNAGISETGNGRKTMIRSLEASLKRLKTDYVDGTGPTCPTRSPPSKRSSRPSTISCAPERSCTGAYPTSLPGG